MAESRAEVPSPCTSVCRMNAATGWCEGCFRTIDEIVRWASLDTDGRLAVWGALRERRSASRHQASDSTGSRLAEPPDPTGSLPAEDSPRTA